ncbi:deoxycytidylate deaminase-like [Amphibalanus amphitrite]|uniref:deoxycytidylate deaminase-like n=1 Tax=Amphibalanus amphitrite TaxID=1232801 RepID=UPI001C90B503|nr:deoxycytidylate deaminase-like [Amphibalanus amphitrite]XP_043219617.1 deoxycytidylate deaminase-like [Amphibalanus amphitrite]
MDSRDNDPVPSSEQSTGTAGSGASDKSDSAVSMKRSGYLEWQEYFMAICFLSAMRSKDPATQVGACIVNDDRKIVGIGYNGMPLGCSDDRLPWSKTASDTLDTKYMYVCHAEMNAIMNKNSADVKGCTIYVALFPCNECAKLIIQSGIRKVVYASDKHASKKSTIASKRLLEMAGVECCQYEPKRRQVVIDFDVIDRSGLSQLPDSPPRQSPDPGPQPEPADCADSVRRNLSALMVDQAGHEGL